MGSQTLEFPSVSEEFDSWTQNDGRHFGIVHYKRTRTAAGHEMIGGGSGDDGPPLGTSDKAEGTA